MPPETEESDFDGGSFVQLEVDEFDVEFELEVEYEEVQEEVEVDVCRFLGGDGGDGGPGESSRCLEG